MNNNKMVKDHTQNQIKIQDGSGQVDETKFTTATTSLTSLNDATAITTLSIAATSPDFTMSLKLHNNTESFVTIHANGEVEFGPGYTPAAAANVFWKSLGVYRNQDIPTEGPIADKISEYIDDVLQPAVTFLEEDKDFYSKQLNELGDFLSTNFGTRIIGSAVETAIEILSKDLLGVTTLNDRYADPVDTLSAYDRAMGVL